MYFSTSRLIIWCIQIPSNIRIQSKIFRCCLVWCRSQCHLWKMSFRTIDIQPVFMLINRAFKISGSKDDDSWNSDDSVGKIQMNSRRESHDTIDGQKMSKKVPEEDFPSSLSHAEMSSKFLFECRYVQATFLLVTWRWRLYLRFMPES